MLYFLIAALLFNNIYSCSGNYYENKLKTEILKDYNKFTIPSNKSLVNLQMGIAFRAFNNIDQIDGTLTTNIWLRHYWKDDYLTWNPSDYDNITEITLPTDPDMDASIWVPDIYLYNTAELPLQDLDHSLANIDYQGNVMWSRPGIVMSTCIFMLEDFPYDQQECYLKFGSWSYNRQKLNLSFWETAVDITNYQRHQGWKLVETSYQLNEQYYSCCTEPYQDIMFYITLRRNPDYYIINIIVPTFATATLMVLSFIIPNSSGERISFAVTVMLSIIVFLLILSENLPKTKEMPLLSRMLIGLTFFSLVSVFFTVIISAMYSIKDKKKHRISDILRYLFCFSCMKKESDDDSDSQTLNNDTQETSFNQNIINIVPEGNSSEYNRINGLVFRAIRDSQIRNSQRNDNDNGESDSDSDSDSDASSVDSDTKNFNKQCRNIAELMEKYLTYGLVIGFALFCIIMFSKRPNYDD